MIIVRPVGGMGNQMYAYALGKALSLKKQTSLFIDKSWMKEVGAKRDIDMSSLSHFKLTDSEWRLSRSRLGRLFLSGKLDRLYTWLADRWSKSHKRILIEKACRYDDWILNIQSRSIYIRGGTWQSYKYFAEYTKEIKQAFEFKPEVYEQNREMAERILNDSNTVSVHVRRGDYVTNANCDYTQGICTSQYYGRAMDHFSRILQKPTFYFFSDDIAFVKQEFGLSDRHVFIERRESRSNEVGYRDDGHNDMFLMSLCRHNIIANSTFSWWAAYLNKHENKTVVAPGRWYRDIVDDSFILMPEWIRIDG